MDKREMKTKRSIRNTFLTLRSKKPIEKITVKELADQAEIGKATFYLHYKDIYDLSDQIGQEIITSVLNNITDVQNIILHPEQFTRELFNGFAAKQEDIEIIFSGSQQHKLIDNIEQSILQTLLEHHPEYTDDLHFRIALTYRIKGCYYTFLEWAKQYPADRLIDEICRIQADSHLS